MNKSGIYMIFNTYNNKCYVGSTKNFRIRKAKHYRQLLLNKHHSQHLQKAYNKYGKDKFIFIILEECEIENLIDREIWWIKTKKSLNSKYGYNISIPLKNNSLELRPETILKKKIDAYNQYYKKEDNITLEEFLKGKRKGGYKKVENPINSKKKVLGFNKKTGELVKTFNSISEISKKCWHKAIDNPNKTYKGMILVKEENYIPSKTYKKVYKKRKEYVPKGRFKGYPIKCINIETKEEIIFNNKFEAISSLGFTIGGINKVLYGTRKSHKGYIFKLLK